MIIRIRLLLSSHVPLYVVTLLLLENPIARILTGLVALLGLLSLVSLVRTSTRAVESRIAAPTSVRDLSNDVVSYVATYLLPFVTLNDPTLVNIVAFLIVLMTASILYVRSDMIGANPLMALAGYRIYAVLGVRQTVDGAESEAILLSRTRILPGRDIRLADLASGIAVAKDITEESED